MCGGICGSSNDGFVPITIDTISVLDTDVGSYLAVNTALRRVALLVIACVVSAVTVGGIGGRIVMRISAAAAGPTMVGRITENGNRVGEFTVGGTLFLIVLTGIFAGLFGTVIVVGSDPWLRWMGPLQGFGFGLAVLAVNGQQENFGSTDFLMLEPASLNVAMFVSLNVLFGFAVSGVYWLLNRWLPSAAETTEQPVWLMLARLPCVGGFLLLMAYFTVPGFSGAEASYGIAAIMVVMVASTVVKTVSSFSPSIPMWAVRTVTLTGYGSMLVFLVVGMAGTVQEIQRIL
jgi:hypothetical protein